MTLVEAILYLTLMSSFLAFSASVLEDEKSRQQDAVAAADLRQVITSAQTFVAVEYDEIRRKLVADTPVGEPVIAEIPMAEMVDAGFLPDIFVGGGAGMRQIHGQEYALLARAVLRNPPTVASGGPPPPATQATVIKSDAIVLPGTDTIRPELTDRQASPAVDTVPANDELDLEVILVTTGTSECGVRTQTGNRIIDLTQLPSAGFMRSTVACPPPASPPPAVFSATGPHGGWTLDLTPYADLGFLAPGRFASLVALSRYGVLSTTPADDTPAEGVSRCADVTPGTAQFQECLARDEVYSSVVFNAWDSDANGTADTYPTIQNAYGISFAPPVDVDGDAKTDAQIGNLLSISCLAGGQVTTATSSLSVDCPTTSLHGALTVYSRAGNEADTLAATPAFEVTPTGIVKVSQSLEVDGTLQLAGADVAPKLASTSSVWTTCSSHKNGCFIEGQAALVTLPSCPAGSNRVVTASPVAFQLSDDVTKIEVTTTPQSTNSTGTHWRVELKRTRTINNGDNSTSTTSETNPAGTKLLVQSRCETT